MSRALADAVADEIERLIQARGRAIGLLDASPILADTYNYLREKNIDWIRVIGLQTAEFMGLGEEDPGSARKFLLDRLVRKVPMAEFHPLRGDAANPAAVRANYAALLKTRPPDFALLGIGEDGQVGSPELSGQAGRIGLTLDAVLQCETVFVAAVGDLSAKVRKENVLAHLCA